MRACPCAPGLTSPSSLGSSPTPLSLFALSAFACLFTVITIDSYQLLETGLQSEGVGANSFLLFWLGCPRCSSEALISCPNPKAKCSLTPPFLLLLKRASLSSR